MNFYTFTEMVWIIYALFFLTLAVHALERIFRWRPVLKAAILSVLIVAAAGYLIGLIYKVNYYQDLAFLTEAAEAKFEPRAEAMTHFRLKEGSRVKVLRPQGPWVKVKRPDGRIGWVRQESVEEINGKFL